MYQQQQRRQRLIRVCQKRSSENVSDDSLSLPYSISQYLRQRPARFDVERAGRAAAPATSSHRRRQSSALLSVQYSMGGNRLFSSLGFGLPFSDGLLSGGYLSRSFQFAPTPPATTKVLKPVSNNAFLALAARTSITVS